jgi:lipopolysaccharide biosynthesis glycosyltransferase
MNCIFICVFNQEKYIELLYLLLESIDRYGKLDNNIEILIYTSTQFMNIIKKSRFFNEKIQFEINNTYNTIELACKARLNLFNLNSVKRYQKILYLDTDILIKGDLKVIFNLCKLDILYVLQEYSLKCNDHWYGGKTLFGDEIEKYKDISAFTSGILLFNNCEKIKFLFNEINKDMVLRPFKFSCHDQPYIVYSAFKHNLFNNKILKNYAANNNDNISGLSRSVIVVHHKNPSLRKTCIEV